MTAPMRDLKAIARRAAVETAAAQGFGPKVTDLGVLRRVATLMQPPPDRNTSHPSTPPTGHPLPAGGAGVRHSLVDPLSENARRHTGSPTVAPPRRSGPG